MVEKNAARRASHSSILVCANLTQSPRGAPSTRAPTTPTAHALIIFNDTGQQLELVAMVPDSVGTVQQPESLLRDIKKAIEEMGPS